MIDLKLPEYRIKEFKYQLKEGKTAIIKLSDGALDDIEIIEEANNKKEPIEEHEYQPFSSINEYKGKKKESDGKPVGELETKELGKFIMDYLKEKEPKEGEHPFSRKVKELHDYEPTSCLESEKGMQETLDAARKKEWIEDVKNKPSAPTETGNALVKTDIIVEKTKDKKPSYSSTCATMNEILKFNSKQIGGDKEIENYYQEKIDKKLVTDLVKSKKIIDEYVTKTSDIEKKRFEDRVKYKYFKEDPNDDFSKIKSLGDLNNKLIEENGK